MQEMDRKIFDRFYLGNYQCYGVDPRSLGWTPGGQERRYRAIVEIGDLDGSSVLDVGCGFGDLYQFLKDRGIRVDYTGIDLYGEFVEQARVRHREARFVVGDFEENGIEGRYDWVFAVGIFNRKVANHCSFVERTLRRMFTVAEKGIAADFLGPRLIDITRKLYHPEPREILEICSKMSSRLVIRGDYQPGEFCAYVFKDRGWNPRSSITGLSRAEKQFDLRKDDG